jgi:hypothetical protein
MSPQAGMGLLTIVGSVEKRRLLLKALSTAVYSTMDYVSVSVRLSGLQPIKMFFVPKGSQKSVTFLLACCILIIIIIIILRSMVVANAINAKSSLPKPSGK